LNLEGTSIQGYLHLENIGMREIEVLNQKVRHFDRVESDPDQLRYIRQTLTGLNRQLCPADTESEVLSRFVD
jgi:hypothetical protein